MNQTQSYRRLHSTTPAVNGFTLIELLTVIAIIGILASLVVGGAALAIAKGRRAGVEAQREALIAAIESYKNSKGYYPPDNPNIAAKGYTYQNPLFYELTGTVATNGGFAANTTTEKFTAGNMLNDFGVSGFLNSSVDPTVVVNYYVGLKATQHQLVKPNAPGVDNYSVIGINVPGPNNLQSAALNGGFSINPWNYVVSHPTNNVDSYDLWMDVTWRGKTNRISNWSKDPQEVAY